MPNHNEIMDILEKKIHLARAHTPLADALLRYIRHLAVYKALRASGIYDRDPLQFDEPYPQNLFSLVEQEKDRLQQEYDRLLSFS